MALSINPNAGLVTPNGKLYFAASGGTGPYTFAVSSNRSGGSVNATTGAYVAGPHGLVTDVVTVTDSLATTANASVKVTAGLYQNFQQRKAPPSMRLPNGQIVEGDYGAEKDQQFERARQGVLSNLPGVAPYDALDLIGQERQLPRATTETSDSGGTNDAAYAERLRTMWTDAHGWSPAGSHASLLYALDRAGFPMGDPAGAHIMQRHKRYSWLTGSGGTPVYGTHPLWDFDGSDPRMWNQFGILFGADVSGLSDGTDSAKLLNSIVDLWRPRKARFMGTWIFVTEPLIWDWPPVTYNWNDGGLTWDSGSVRFVQP